MNTIVSLLFGCAMLSWTGAVISAEQIEDATEELRSTLQDQKEIAVTIYNQQLALVKDVRAINLQKGLNRLAFRDVSAEIKPETAALRDLNPAGGIHLLEQNFDFDLLSPNKLLQKFVGKRVRVVRTHPDTGVESEEEALVLSANNGVVLKIGDRIETAIPGRLVFDRIPENLRDRPTLMIMLDSDTEGTHQLELSYLTGGLSWKADYVAELNPEDDRMDLNGWVTLTNQSGTSYRDARLQLVAGDVNRVRERKLELMASAVPQRERAVREDMMTEESLFEYHLYSLQRPTTIADNQTKQVALLSASGIDVHKEFVLKGLDFYYRGSHGDLGQKLKVGVFVKIKNAESSNLGMPLPKGIVRVYKRDGRGNAQFVGEDRIDHTPKNEEIRLKLGDAFDVTADKKQTDFRKIAAVGRYNFAFESSYEIELKNAKTQAVTVLVQEPVPGDWEIVAESHPHEKQAAGTAVWRIKVPAEGKSRLTYTVQVRY